MVQRLRPLLPVLAALLATACGDSGRSPAETFAHLTIAPAGLDGRSVTLEGGGATLEAEGIEIHLDPLHLRGMLGTPPRPVTTGILHLTWPGGGQSTELLIAEERDDRMEHLASIELGGALRIEGIRYDQGEIVLHLLDYASDDPPCCPSLPQLRRFSLDQEGRLEDLLTDPPPGPDEPGEAPAAGDG